MTWMQFIEEHNAGIGSLILIIIFVIWDIATTDRTNDQNNSRTRKRS